MALRLPSLNVKLKTRTSTLKLKSFALIVEKKFRAEIGLSIRLCTLKNISEFSSDDGLFRTDNAYLENSFIVRQENELYKNYFQATQTTYSIEVRLGERTLNELYLMFEQIKDQSIKKYNRVGIDILRIIIYHPRPNNYISTAFYCDINISEYDINLIIIKIPRGQGRLQATLGTMHQKMCIISVKNTDTLCLAWSIVTVTAVQEPEKYTKSQLNDGIKKSRMLQEESCSRITHRSWSTC